MNEASLWRSTIAEKLARLYAQNPQVAAVILGGSTARGHADQFSDIELGVFWHQSPTDAERQHVIDTAGADLIWLYPYEPDEHVWCDDYMMGRAASGQPKTGVLIEAVHYLAAFAMQTIEDVVSRHSTSEAAHNLIAGILDARPLHGEALVQAWQAQARTYPRELAIKLINAYGVIDHFWRWEMYLQRGENLMLLYQSFAQVQQKILHMLLALNGVYYSGFKWLDVVLARCPIQPVNLAARLRNIYQLPGDAAAQQLTALVEETYTLIEQTLPEVNVTRLREIFHYRRPIWTHSPFDPATE
jgi:hypothetical protein